MQADQAYAPAHHARGCRWEVRPAEKQRADRDVWPDLGRSERSEDVIPLVNPAAVMSSTSGQGGAMSARVMHSLRGGPFRPITQHVSPLW